MQTYERVKHHKSIIQSATGTLDFALYTVFLQVLVVFQSAFMFVAALQANEMISGAIKNDITSKEVALKITTIFALIPMTIIIAYFKHMVVNLNTESARRYKEMPIGAKIGEDDVMESLSIFAD